MAHRPVQRTLAVPVDPERDHVWGPPDAPVTVVEYGDYECPYCQQVWDLISDVAEQNSRFRYVYRHFPLSGTHPNAQLAAEAAEAAGAQGKFWEMHERLYQATGVEQLTRERVIRHAREIGLDVERFERELGEGVYEAHVMEDFESGLKSGVRGTPAFFVNGTRYEGPWDSEAIQDAINRPFGTRFRGALREFMRIEASGGILLMIAAVFALIWANSPWSDVYFNILDTDLAIELGPWRLSMHLLHWVNDALMALFFLVVGLEIKRELLVGQLSKPRQAVLPLMAGLGGMLMPALLYTVVNWGGPGASGWGIPMATDIAFMLGVLALLGSRAPLSLKVFFTALAIADDLGAVLVIAIFYSGGIAITPLAIAGALLLVLVLFNLVRVYHPIPYAVVGLGLWLAVLFSGIHATIAGVLLAMTIPARTTANTTAFVAQINALLREFQNPTGLATDDRLGTHGGARQAVAQTMEMLAERLESPLQRLERTLHPWTTYLILPIFAWANAGVDLRGDLAAAVLSPISLGIILGLVLGKSIGITLFTWVTVKLGLGDLPIGVTWRHVYGGAWLAGIGFTMSLFIATANFTGEQLAAAKVGIIGASLVAGTIGSFLLSRVSARVGVSEMEAEPVPAAD